MLIFLNLNLKIGTIILDIAGCQVFEILPGLFCLSPLYRAFARVCVRVCLVFFSPIRLKMNHAADAQ